jgi:hypothetical protein
MVHWAMLLTRPVSHVADEIRIHNFTVSIRQALSTCELFWVASRLERIRAAIRVVVAFFTLSVNAGWKACECAITVSFTLKAV